MPSLSSITQFFHPQEVLAGGKDMLTGLQKRRGMVLGVWVAFWVGILGANVLQETHKPFTSPEALLVLKPAPLPLVQGKDPEDLPLPAAPDKRVQERSAEGDLPVMGAGGLGPYTVYAYPFDQADKRPRIALLLTGLGQQLRLLDEVSQKLPGAVGLSLDALTPELASAVASLRKRGHEVLLTIPAEGPVPADGAYEDAGPGALRPSLSLEENMQRLHLAMARATGYVGLSFNPQAAVVQQDDMQRALSQESLKRGLVIVSPDFPDIDPEAKDKDLRLKPAQRLDLQLTPEGVDLALSDVEQRAREQGAVLAVADASPLIIDRLSHWLPDVTARGYALAPVSALAPILEPVTSAAHTANGATTDTHGAAPTHEAAHETDHKATEPKAAAHH